MAASPASPEPPDNQPPGQPPICQQLWHQSKTKNYMRRVYLHRVKIKRKTKDRIALQIRCQASGARGRHLVRRFKRKMLRKRKVWLAMRRLTPYRGPHGTRWAIPYRIVYCESKGRWNAYNASGATGPYQLLGKGVSLSDPPIVHHRVAAALWNGGAGASHWVCA